MVLRNISRRLLYRYKQPFTCKCNYSTVSDKKWQSVVGLEVHAQLNTETKLFSGAQNTFGGLVNNCVALLDAAVPGTLPALNRKCVELGVKTALALSCKVNEVSTFDRKHYFYADLPAGYQITQQRAPLASDGVINFQVFTPGIHKKPYKKSSKIKQIQLEQDSGKSLHDDELKRSLVDLNRAGAPLIELVFEPDLEIKNIGSVRGVAGAIRHEIERQKAILESGGRIVNETRSWDAVARITIAMRDKEVVQDYSVPLIQDKMPELPEDSRRKLVQDYQLRSDTAIQLVNEPLLLEYFHHLVSGNTQHSTKIANLLINDLLTVLNKKNLDIEECNITVKQLKELTDMFIQKQISLDVCKKTLSELIDSSDALKSPAEIVNEKGWLLITDEEETTKKCREVIQNNPKLVKQYKDGKVKVFQALLGMLVKSTNNKLDMSLASKKMEELLKK
ncbi:hypothetical protein MSG28_008751 [Choristoneura fumiferana]|uniref:Uncharacterized protein n=2 Tax=Choristoneura fumiferana TaxID=7141 RepID=A0ACC0J7W9_CHOFU|nr:hypothetical protein MSG28_008751 [Choristoneura fumiferana]